VIVTSASGDDRCGGRVLHQHADIDGPALKWRGRCKDADPLRSLHLGDLHGAAIGPGGHVASGKEDKRQKESHARFGDTFHDSHCAAAICIGWKMSQVPAAVEEADQNCPGREEETI